ncbi:MAG: GNAT family N-acetyltransferase [Methanoregula sp.]|nr:GNAT family N-acetyltransferase [Methanoregula sp.]
MDVRIATDSDREQWNRFVDREGGSFFQYYDWKFVYDFKNQDRFLPLLIRENKSEILGIFPLVEQKAARIYPWLSSLPEGATGGFLLKKSLSEEEKSSCLNQFFTFIDTRYASSHSLITIREQITVENESIEPTKTLLDQGFLWMVDTSTRLPCTHYLKLVQPFEEKIWKGLWSKAMRNRIRHARKTGLHVVTDDRLEYLDDYVDMQVHINKKIGFMGNRDRIARIARVFQSRMKLFIGLLDAQPVSAALCFYTPTTAYLSKAPYLPRAYDYLTNTLPICASIQYACDAGYRYFEMGTTTTPHLALYKEKFKATRMPMRIYTKKFSLFKFYLNKVYGFITD